MPIFEYLCKNCSRRFELLLPGDIEKCPSCSSTDLEKLLSVPASLKNTGTGTETVTRCGRTQTCCGSKSPCSSPSCGN